MPGHSSLKVHFHLKGSLKDAVSPWAWASVGQVSNLLFLFCSILFIEGLSMQSSATSFLGDKDEYEMDLALKVLTF